MYGTRLNSKIPARSAPSPKIFTFNSETAFIAPLPFGKPAKSSPPLLLKYVPARPVAAQAAVPHTRHQEKQFGIPRFAPPPHPASGRRPPNFPSTPPCPSPTLPRSSPPPPP